MSPNQSEQAADVLSITDNATQSQSKASTTFGTTQKSGQKARKDLALLQSGIDDQLVTTNGAAAAQSFLALCVNTSGVYKVCSEIPIYEMSSDAQLFLEMKRRYQEKRGRWSRFNFLVKPSTIEFIQVRKRSIFCSTKLKVNQQCDSSSGSGASKTPTFLYVNVRTAYLLESRKSTTFSPAHSNHLQCRQRSSFTTLSMARET
jgi:hypothetical protein